MDYFPYTIDDELELVFLSESDAEELFERVEANRARLRTWMPWLDSTQGPEDILGFICRAQDELKSNTAVHLGIRFKGEIVGVSGFASISEPNHSAKIGYWVCQSVEGKGLVTRAVKSLVDVGFTHLGLNRIAIRAAVGNERSAAVPKRLGFTLEGVRRQAEFLYDHYVDLQEFALLKEEWLAAKQPE